MSKYSFDDLLISDLHKDAYGFRPSSDFFSSWRAMSDDQKQETWDFLCRRLQEEQEIERKRANASYELWDERINDLMARHGISRGAAIRWDMQAEGVGDDIGYYCYNCGLSYSTEDEILEMLAGE